MSAMSSFAAKRRKLTEEVAEHGAPDGCATRFAASVLEANGIDELRWVEGLVISSSDNEYAFVERSGEEAARNQFDAVEIEAQYEVGTLETVTDFSTIHSGFDEGEHASLVHTSAVETSPSSRALWSSEPAVLVTYA
jgi:hypothetical protein